MQKKIKEKRGEEQRELEKHLETCFQEMVIDLNLCMLADMDAKTCMTEPLLWVDSITLMGVVYPDIPCAKSFRQWLMDKTAALWKYMKHW